MLLRDDQHQLNIITDNDQHQLADENKSKSIKIQQYQAHHKIEHDLKKKYEN